MHFLLKTLCFGLFLHLITAEYIVPIVPIDDVGETTTPNPVPPKCTGSHEVWTECGNDSCVRDCSTFGLSNIACRPSCNPGCICEWRYYRNADGVCVKPEDCGIDVCPEPNEEFTSCLSPCGENCLTLGQKITCNFLVCNPGCDCKLGFFRNTKGECVTPDQCAPCNGDVNANPSDGCNCKTGYIKNKAGKCAAVPLPKCGQNEVVDKCALCDDLTCANVFAGEVARCTKPPGCPVACRCKAGYVRNNKKQCIKSESCCSDPNSELVSSPSPCAGGTCECPAFANCKTKPSAKGCRCKAGFLKKSAADVTCVAIKSCPKKAATSPLKY